MQISIYSREAVMKLLHSNFPEADKLAEFIYEAASDGLDIICQCEHGESRSFSCAAAILEHFNQRSKDRNERKQLL